MLCIYNVTNTWRHVPGWVLRDHGLGSCLEALSGEWVTPGPDDRVGLPPYAVAWFVAHLHESWADEE